MIDSLFFVGRNKDADIVNQSSSGGIMSVVANWIFEKGGIVFGAAFIDNYSEIHHIRVDSVDELSKLRKSKYVWSDYVSCFDELEDTLKCGMPVLFIGTPCQCMSIKNKFGKYKKLFLLDFFCHGTLEPYVFKKYIDGLNDTVKYVDFRHERHGDSQNFTFYIAGEKNKVLVEEDYNSNLLTSLFVNSCGLRTGCFHCSLCTKKHVSNVTMGDVEFDDMARRHGFEKKHLSIVSINDEIGMKFFDESKQKMHLSILDHQDEQEIEFYFREHANSKKPWEYDWERKKWFDKALKQYEFSEAVYRCINYYDLIWLNDCNELIRDKRLYLYGCGYKGTKIKRLIDQFYPSWHLYGYIVTKKNACEVNNLPVYEINDVYIDENTFILVSVENNADIYKLLKNRGLEEGKDYV